MSDIIGKQFKHWTVEGEEKAKGQHWLIVRCVCGVVKKVNYYNVIKGASSSCGCQKVNLSRQTCVEKFGVDNVGKLQEIKEKREQTCIERYGVTNPLASKECREKGKKTLMEHFGVDVPAKSEQIKEKMKKTCLEKYGKEYASQTQEFKDKVAKTNLENYGHKCAAQSPEIAEKIKQINLEKYGAECSFGSKEVREKCTQTFLEKYGVPHPAQADEIKEKTKQTNLDRHGVEWTMQSEDVRKKSEQTNIERYGSAHPNHDNEEAREKRKETCLKRFGVEYPMQAAQIKAKLLETLVKNDGRSSGERELVDFIQALGFSPKKTFVGGSDPFEIDIWVPEKKFALEYDGEYFHSELQKKGKYRGLFKTKRTTEILKTHLIHIFHSEWLEKREAVQSFIKSKLLPQNRIRASRCEMRKISYEEAKPICEGYHIQGMPRNTLCSFGLFYEGKLIMVAVVSPPHRQTLKRPQLARICTMDGYRVLGGLSRLSKRIFNEIGEFETFVHIRFSDGSSYRNAGFQQLHTSRPDYFYLDTRHNKIVPKQARRKTITKTPKNMTEHEHALAEGLVRVYDCGKIKFLYTGPTN